MTTAQLRPNRRRVVKGLAKRGNRSRHGLRAKYVDVSLFARKSGYSPMTLGFYQQPFFSCLHHQRTSDGTRNKVKSCIGQRPARRALIRRRRSPTFLQTTACNQRLETLRAVGEVDDAFIAALEEDRSGRQTMQDREAL